MIASKTELERLDPSAFPAWPQHFFDMQCLNWLPNILAIEFLKGKAEITPKDFKHIQRECRKYYELKRWQIPISIANTLKLENICGVRAAAMLRHEKTQLKLKVVADYLAQEKKRHEANRQRPILKKKPNSYSTSRKK